LGPATRRGWRAWRAGRVKRGRPLTLAVLTLAVLILAEGGPAQGGLGETIRRIAGLLETLLRIDRGLVRLSLIGLAGTCGQETALLGSSLTVTLLAVAA
jgi:hypothetical protein